MSLNTIKVPSLEQLGEVASELGLALPEAELAAHHRSLLGAFEAYSRLDRMPDELPPVSYPRLPGRRPTAVLAMSDMAAIGVLGPTESWELTRPWKDSWSTMKVSVSPSTPIACREMVMAWFSSVTTELATATGGRIESIQCDVRDAGQVESMMSQIWERGPLDVLVNNAAANFIARTEKLSPRAIDAEAGRRRWSLTADD